MYFNGTPVQEKQTLQHHPYYPILLLCLKEIIIHENCRAEALNRVCILAQPEIMPSP